MYSVQPFTRSPRFVTLFSTRPLPLPLSFSTVLSVPPVLSLSFLSLYFLSASGEQSPSLLLLPGPIRHCNQTPGISSGPTLAGWRTADKTL